MKSLECGVYQRIRKVMCIVRKGKDNDDYFLLTGTIYQ